ncbi:hypothetical protein QVD17_25692 [Tagetes erecta]|uniref:Sey1/RHD3-like three-helix bundle domain-containing protein n=1 Tax=Tagetes erecta TaxID=13708 RepID=A0AAD8KMY7_TARER|nr:hypothetical protein QVD17_25692 [Tagetes erecta]
MLQDWLKLEEAVKSERVKGFGNKLSSLIDDCVSSYDEEVTHYDGIVVSERRKQLYEKLMQLVAPSYALMFQHIQSEAMEHFKTTLKIKSILIEGRGYDVATKESMRRFDELCEDAAIKQVKWDLTILRKRFSNDMDSHITDLRMLDEFEWSLGLHHSPSSASIDPDLRHLDLRLLVQFHAICPFELHL